MPVFEIHGREVAHSVCAALIAVAQLDDGETLALVEPGRAPAPWSVEIMAGADAIHLMAYGDGRDDEDPQFLETFTVPYLDGPQIMMLDAEYCGRVAAVAQQALDLVTAMRGEHNA